MKSIVLKEMKSVSGSEYMNLVPTDSVSDTWGDGPLRVTVDSLNQRKRKTERNSRCGWRDGIQRHAHGTVLRVAYVYEDRGLVNTRHECAHLRSSTGFGITYGDACVESDVERL